MRNRKNEIERINRIGYHQDNNPDKLFAKFCLNGMDQATAEEKVKKMFPQWKH